VKKIFISVLILFFGLPAFADDNCVITDIINGKNIHTCKTVYGDKKCLISRIGDDSIDYRFDGQINRIGNKNVYYQNGKIVKIGDDSIRYWSDGKILEIGDKTVYYQNGRIIKIGSDSIKYDLDGEILKFGDKWVNYQMIED
jgi:imidazolonepropionase-like amidohydrolase